MDDSIRTRRSDLNQWQNLADRRKRLEDRVGRLRTLLAGVVTELPGRVYRYSLAHVRAFDVDPRVIVTDESAIPSTYWVPQDLKLNESAIRKHLLERQTLIDLLKECRGEDERRTKRTEIDRDFPDTEGAYLGNGEIESVCKDGDRNAFAKEQFVVVFLEKRRHLKANTGASGLRAMTLVGSMFVRCPYDVDRAEFPNWYAPIPLPIPQFAIGFHLEHAARQSDPQCHYQLPLTWQLNWLPLRKSQFKFG